MQLLLLVDYIFDWARDCYREDVLRELRVLATGSNDAASVVCTDPDIFSALAVDNVDNSWNPSEDTASFQTFASAKQIFTEMDTHAGVIRHASLVESKYCCVFVTVDNVSTLRRSIQQHKLVELCKQVLTHMKDASLVGLSALDAIERQWTGRNRLSSQQLVETKFYTVISFTAYLSSSWQITRELFAVAIAEDAWPEVILASKLKPDRGKTRTPIGRKLDEATLLESVKQLQAGSPLQVLDTAISRRAVKIRHSFGKETCFILDDGELRRTVNFVYQSFKKGYLEPQEPFLRCSERLDQQRLLNCEVEPYFSSVPLVSKDGCVLVTATCYPENDPDRTKSEFCAYLTSGAPDVPPRGELHSIVMRTFQTHDVYHTTRGHWSSVLAPLKKMEASYRKVWNLENTYGVYSRGFEFLDLIETLCPESKRLPVTQGSSRASDASGSQLYSRNFSPWSDPRFLYTDRKERMFFLYKLFSREIRFWRQVALKRRRQGLPCCEICAAVEEDCTGTICEDCETALFEPDRYTWFTCCMMGEQAFQIAPLEEPELQKRMERSENHGLSLRQYIWNKRYDGPTDDDDDWAWNLDFYAKLEEPFHNMREFQLQWLTYRQFCKENRWPALRRMLKRKREEALDIDAKDQQDYSLVEPKTSPEVQEGSVDDD